ncbi:hypothetical protein [Haliangium ochraceum]|uniref:Uncharacterized protein n=1 Tax=Haliangium ochraceum (strain DSM 14365 / JCM 11303 / SMP-2) TaxID=502025 RepID=D0LWC2_HALO1|nr:hypothetical protein [Haliangium ochraceum]ACY16054.1 hypothetical protein Hoch_3552 [Haliangium ochraceum DSM 14365]
MKPEHHCDLVVARARRSLSPWLAASLCALVLSGCGSFDDERRPAPEQSFGEVVTELSCQRIAYLDDLSDDDGRVDVSGARYREACRGQVAAPASAPADMRTLLAERDALVAALDSAAPAAFLPALQQMLTNPSFLALYDSDAATRAIDALVALLRFSAGDSAEAVALRAAVERTRGQVGYRPMDAAPGMLGALVAYPELSAAAAGLTGHVVEGGDANAAFTTLLAGAGAELRTASAAEDPGDPDRSGALVAELLLDSHPLLAEAAPPEDAVGTPLELVRRDSRGVALVQPDGDGALPAPFVDEDGDDLADIDAEGRFVGAGRAPIAAPSPYARPEDGDGDAGATPWPYRDPQGRALSAPLSEGGAPLYQHLALGDTVLAALLRDLPSMAGGMFDMVHGVRGLMGERGPVDAIFSDGSVVRFTGFAIERAPLLDMSYGYLQLLRAPDIDELLRMGELLLRDDEAAVARLAETLFAIARLGDAHPGARLVAGSPFWDDLAPVLRDIAARPALMDDLLRALEDPAVLALEDHLLRYMRYRDRFSYDEDGNVLGEFTTEVDRAMADSGFNRSLWQRLLHLITDANGAVLCSKAGAEVTAIGITLDFDDECELLRIDNLALFYLQSMVYAKDSDGDIIYDDGEPRTKAELELDSTLIDIFDFFFDLDDFLEEESGIDGFRTHPTPEALTRVLLLDPAPAFIADVHNPAVCRDGERFIDAHTGTLQVWEADDFYTGLRPILQAFADHDQELLFLDILEVLHTHWPSPESADHQSEIPEAAHYAWGSALVSYEPLVIDVVDAADERRLLPALAAAAGALGGIEPGELGGQAASAVLSSTMHDLLAPRDGLSKRDGTAASETNDGRPVPVLSPFYVLADAYARRDAVLAGAPDEAAAWHRGVRQLIDAMMRGEEQGGEWRFRNPRMRGLGLVMLAFVRERMAAHQLAGDREQWLSDGLIGDLEELMRAPATAGMLDLQAAIGQDPALRQHLEALVAHAFDESARPEAFANAAIAAADLVQFAVYDQENALALAHWAGDVLQPERGWVAPLIAFVHGAARDDSANALGQLLRNLTSMHRPGRTPLGEIATNIERVQRAAQMPAGGEIVAPPTRADYPAILRGVADFLDEEQRGLRKFLAIIKGRTL